MFLIVASLALAGCGWLGFGDGNDDDEAPDRESARAEATSTPRATATPSPSPTPSPTPTEALSEEERFLADVAGQWEETDTVHFELTIHGTSYLDNNETIELESAEGDLARPDQARADADISIGFADFDVSIIILGNDAYTTNFLSGRWERAPSGFDFNPARLFDENVGISNVLQEVRDPEIVGTEQIGNREAQHLTGFVSDDDISDVVAGSLAGQDIRIDIWADERTHDVLRIILTEPGNDPLSWEITFSNHNAEVAIVAPDL